MYGYREWRNNVAISFDSFSITYRELIASIVIICLMIGIGFGISGAIQNSVNDNLMKYKTADKIETDSMFDYAVRTNSGYAFIYGTVAAIDPVSTSEIKGEYMVINKTHEHYTMHTRVVTETDSEGHSRSHTETYYTWDATDSENFQSRYVTFHKYTCLTTVFTLPSFDNIDVVYQDSNDRNIYTGLPTSIQGTVFSCIDNHALRDKSPIYRDSNIEKTLHDVTTTYEVPFFWCVWVILIGCAVFGFYYFPNNWLE